MLSVFRKYFLFFTLVFFGYIGEVCIMPYIKIFGVSPNLLYVVIGIVTVAYGKLRAFWAGMIYALLMQIMLPSVSYLNLALYSLTTLFCSFAFADKPLKTLEYERAVNRQRKELPPWLRTLLCTMLNMLIYEIVNITYIYLSGTELTIRHCERALASIFVTSMLCLLLEFPIRRAVIGKSTRSRQIVQPAPVVFGKN